ncbi:GNAT family N-acetyltransferase [Metabacillus iocasae]|uniref:GNAT superfamily N-acetyltransferase n=1 Tax=Priestia iocasae TaxID=2291674 RepID=A0ABS2QU09_9BACI|nr:GNAT family N-acetyltransferase [Metabacillus iocasae]MBM7702929.1 GNAT superfamily N-acetyltransferase [Metabacillus iocasae]
MRVRPFQREDVHEVYALFYRTVHTINKRDYDQRQLEAWAPNDADLQKWEQRLMNSHSFVAMNHDKMVGFASMTEDGYIDLFYVHADHQQEGIGHALFQTLKAYANEKGMKRFVTEASITSKPFFQHQGFRVVKRQRKHLRGVVFINYVMSYELTKVYL